MDNEALGCFKLIISELRVSLEFEYCLRVPNLVPFGFDPFGSLLGFDPFGSLGMALGYDPDLGYKLSGDMGDTLSR